MYENIDALVKVAIGLPIGIVIVVFITSIGRLATARRKANGEVEVNIHDATVQDITPIQTMQAQHRQRVAPKSDQASRSNQDDGWLSYERNDG